MLDEWLIPIGILIILIGFALIIIGIVLTALKSKQTKMEWAFGGFIGPFPFGFANKEGWLKTIIALSIVFLIIFLILNKLII